MKNNFLQGIDTLILRVADIERSKNWFTQKLSFTVLHEDAIHRLAVLDTHSAVSITIWQTDEPIHVNSKTAAYPIFRTANAREAHDHLLAQGVPAGEIITDHVVTYFTFHDPDGNILEVCQVHE